jgi:hypothetical protein
VGIDANKAIQFGPRTQEERDALQEVHKILLLGDRMFAHILVRSMSPTSDIPRDTLQLGSEEAGTREEVNDEMADASADDEFVKDEDSAENTFLAERAIADETDDFIQADIRQQGVAGDHNLEDEISDAMNIVKEEWG